MTCLHVWLDSRDHATFDEMQNELSTWLWRYRALKHAAIEYGGAWYYCCIYDAAVVHTTSRKSLLRIPLLKQSQHNQ